MGYQTMISEAEVNMVELDCMSDADKISKLDEAFIIKYDSLLLRARESRPDLTPYLPPIVAIFDDVKVYDLLIFYNQIIYLLRNK